MKKTLLFIFLVLPMLVFSQNRIGNVADKVATMKLKPNTFKTQDVFKEGFSKITANYKNAVRQGVVVEFDATKVAQLKRDNPQSIEITLPINERGDKATLELFQKDIFSKDFRVRTSDGQDITNSMDRGNHYRGIISGKPHSLVSLSIFNNEVTGFISTEEGNYTIGRLRDSNSRHIIYKDSDLVENLDFDCATEDDGVGYTEEELTYEMTRDPGDCVNIYVESGQSVYNSFGGDLTNTTNFLNALFAESYTLYANDGVTMQTSEMFIWTTPDPYNNGGSSAQLSAFQANTGAFNGDLGHLVELQPGAGGIAAGFSGLCNANTDNSLCFSGLDSNTVTPVPTYSWNVMVVTHEMGHLLGSRHTHACVWNGNNTAIDSCSGFTEGACPLPGSPPGGGTIMSYCHFTTGINFNLGFGPQPSAVINNNINAPGNCLGPCAAPPASDLWSIAQGDDQLRNIDLTDASTLASVTITLAGATINGGNGLATDPTTGTIWALLRAGGIGLTGRALVTIDTGTGVATLIGDTQESFAGIAFNNAGDLYGVTGDGSTTPESLFTLNKTTGAPTFQCTLGNGNDGEALGFNPLDGLFYHASGHTGANVIFETIDNSGVDPCTVTNIDITGTALEDEEAQALTWDGVNGVFLWKQDHGTGPLFSVTTSGVPTLIGNMDHQAKGLTFATVVIGNPPVITCPADIVLDNAAGQCGAVANYAGTAIDTEDGDISGDIVYTPPSGSFFDVGTTTVTASVTDSDGNTSTCDFDVTVNDVEDPVVVCTDFTAELDATGNVTVFPGDVATATDNCPGVTLEFQGSGGPMGSLTSLFGANNGGSFGGAVYFDVTIAGSDLEINAIDVNTADGSGGSFDIDVYTIPGTSVGNETNPGLWTLVSTGTGTAAGLNNPSNAVLATPFTLSASTSYGIAIVMDGSHGHDYTNGTGGNQNFSNADLSMSLGQASNAPFTPGIFSPRVFNGTLHYGSPAPPVPSLDFTCMDVGPNNVTVIATDAAGNTSTCTAVVTVEDNIAPVIVCIGEPTPVTDSASASPGLPFGGAPTVVTSTIDVTDDFIITDLDVDVDISHTWVGDIIVTLESPSGTVVTIIDRPGDITSPPDGCAGDDIVATLDDEAATPVEDECDAGTPTISGSFIPNNPLSAFDGESTLGTWTMTVEDAFPAFDDGVFNSWAINYTHDVTAAPYDAILDGTTGTVTVNVADLLLSVDEACGYTVTTGGGAPIPGSITSLFGADNGGSAGGAVYFDVTVGPEDISVLDIDINTADAGAFTMEVYTLVGTYVGNEGNSGAWTLSANGSGTAMGLDVPSNAVLDAPIVLTAGTTYGMALVLDASHGHDYTNGDGTNQNYSNADVSLSLGAASNAPFDGAPFSPRVFNGTLNYEIGEPASTTIEFDCSQLGLNEVEVTVTDDSGNTSTCTATVNVIDNTDPILVCMDATVELDENGMAEVTPDLFIDTANSFDACGITITAVDVTDVTCDDIGTAITVTVFASDASGNLASCTATLTVVDLLGPAIEGCPADQTVDPGPLNLFYELPDYWALGGITAVDNCTDPVTDFSQTPAAGTLLPDGVYTISICATDEYGNEGCCTFELTIESVLGKDDIALDNAIAMYPNPSDGQVTISNTSNIVLEKAVIYDANGRLVQEVDLRGMATERTFNVSSLASGVYMVQIQSEDAQTVKRLIRR